MVHSQRLESHLMGALCSVSTFRSAEACATYLADSAVSALIDEVSLTPKPGLVDFASNNAHDDMDWALLVASAKTLHSTFYQIALRGYATDIDQVLREDIARIGREGESAMLQVTKGVNTHKGAIWALGLMVAVLASYTPSSLESFASVQLTSLLDDCGVLASLTDRYYQRQSPTKGELSRKRYGVRGALEEAQAGFPTLRRVISLPTTAQSRELYWIERLLQLISCVEDTCIISRSDLSTLYRVQRSASEILALGITTDAGQSAYQQLCQDCVTAHLSPGGSADLLAAIIFLDKLGVINGTVTF